MRYNIYEPFQHWFGHGGVWLYSDPHFGDEEMKTIRKNYIPDVEQVRNINRIVGKKDTIIFLGDIGDTSYIQQIKGYKILIMGNHDKGKNKYIQFFDEVYDGPVIISSKIVLSHEPILIPYLYSIHGHCHNAPCSPCSHGFNCCAEWIDYKPISLLQLLNSGELNKVDDIHRQTIDNATERKRNG